MKTIKVKPIMSVTGIPYKIPKWDEDGNIVWQDSSDELPLAQRQPVLEGADTISLIRYIINRVPQTIQAPKDGYHAFKIMPALEAAKDKDILELDDAQYDWLHRLLRGRKMPYTKEAKDTGQPQQTYVRWLFGLSDYAILSQLTDVDSITEEPKDES